MAIATNRGGGSHPTRVTWDQRLQIMNVTLQVDVGCVLRILQQFRGKKQRHSRRVCSYIYIYIYPLRVQRQLKNSFWENTMILVGMCNQQLQGQSFNGL